MSVRLVCLSDTHGLHRFIKHIPNGDILIHAGDFTGDGDHREFIDFANWIEALPHKNKILVAGNHDGILERVYGQDLFKALAPSVIYLQDSGCEVMGYKVWGSPYTPTFGEWSFMRERGEKIKAHWDKIPNDTEILITHGPAYGMLDRNLEKEACGCRDLTDRVLQVQPLVHCFGHIHDSYGCARMEKDGKRWAVNASIGWKNTTRAYSAVPKNAPIIVDLPYRPIST